MIMEGVTARALTRNLDARHVRLRLDARREVPALLLEDGEHWRPIPLVDIQEILIGSAAEKALNAMLPKGKKPPAQMVMLLLTNGQYVASALDGENSAQKFAHHLQMLCEDIKKTAGI